MSTQPRIAYFSMEIAIEPQIPTYSGGLGVLAGDTLRAAADIGLPLVGISLLHRQGYLKQRLDAEGRQIDEPNEWEPAEFLELLPDRLTVRVEDRDVVLAPWLFRVRGVNGDFVPVYLLDADLSENGADDRALTGRLYGGDARYRLAQEVLLGIGGVAMLRQLGYSEFNTYHM